MGITISYKGTLNNIGSVGKLISEIKDICQLQTYFVMATTKMLIILVYDSILAIQPEG
jgi:hypothetical protein